LQIYYNATISCKRSRPTVTYYNSHVKAHNGLFTFPFAATVYEVVYTPCRAKILPFAVADMTSLPFSVGG